MGSLKNDVNNEVKDIKLYKYEFNSCQSDLIKEFRTGHIILRRQFSKSCISTHIAKTLTAFVLVFSRIFV